jgi:hypothetical protein
MGHHNFAEKQRNKNCKLFKSDICLAALKPRYWYLHIHEYLHRVCVINALLRFTDQCKFQSPLLHTIYHVSAAHTPNVMTAPHDDHVFYLHIFFCYYCQMHSQICDITVTFLYLKDHVFDVYLKRTSRERQ